MQNQLSSTLQILLTRFSGQILIPFAAAVECAGFQQQTARNMLSAKKFPIRSLMNGARRFIHIEDLAGYIEALRVEPKRPGRPKKKLKLLSSASEFDGLMVKLNDGA